MTVQSPASHRGPPPPWEAEGRHNPFPWYSQNREAGALAFHGELNAWGAFRYDECRQVFTDDSRFTSGGGHRGGEWRSPEDRQLALLVDTLPSLQPPEHALHRQLFAQFFTPGAIARYRPAVERSARELLSQAVPRREFDVVADFAYALPMLAIATLLGLPYDLGQFRKFVRGFRGSRTVQDPATGLWQVGDIELAERTRDEFEKFLDPVIEEHSQHESNADPICAALSADLTGISLSRRELVVKSTMMWFGAATHTTQTLITNMLLELHRHPHQLLLVRDDPSLIPGAVEESLRFRGPVFLIGRVARNRTVLGGQEVAAGQRVECWLQPASRDPRSFAEPDVFEVRRRRGIPHLAFGMGPKYCIGAPLARLEGEVALAEWLRAIDSFELAEPTPGDWVESLQVVHLRRLKASVRASTMGAQ